ncbi:MAG: hypothetical protein VB045_06140, partial [Synergistaceae bacterium]|nr:hypothetical protein [Synergistaceae bacterium]
MFHSYYRGSGWSDAIRSGMMDKFRAAGKENLNFYVEYLDAQRTPGEKNLQNTRALLKERYTEKGITFDVILCSDDEALDFLLRFREELFGKIPVVFCGVNDFTPGRLRGQSSITGVNEEISLDETLRVALSLFPSTKTVAAVSGVLKEAWLDGAMEKAAVILAEKGIEMLYLRDLEPDELEKRLLALPESSIILFISYSQTPGGKILSTKEGIDLVKTASGVPLFSFWDVY